MLEYSLTHWLTFFSAAFILTLSPGPDLAFILAQTVRGGRKSGFAALVEPLWVLGGERLTATLRQRPQLTPWLTRGMGAVLVALSLRLALVSK